MSTTEPASRTKAATNLRVIKPDGQEGYLVESAERDKIYRVQIREKGSFCTCPEFLTNWDEGDWRCQHIMAVEDVLKMEADGTFNTNPKETAMNGKINRELLEKPFDANQIKQRQGSHGDVLDYIEAHAVIQRLNDAFEADWSFEVDKYEMREDEVIVLGKLTAAGISKMQFGSAEITKDEEGKVICLGDDLKAAATASIRKCATLFGVGLHLYEERKSRQATQAPAPAQPKPEAAPTAEKPKDAPPANSPGDGRLTNKQLAAIYAVAKSKGLTRQDVERRIVEAYSKRPDYLTKHEASAVIQELTSLSS